MFSDRLWAFWCFVYWIFLSHGFMPVYLTFALKTAGRRDSKAADPVPSPGDGSWPHSSLEGAPLVLGDLTGGAPLVTGDSRVASWAPLEVHHPDASLNLGAVADQPQLLAVRCSGSVSPQQDLVLASSSPGQSLHVGMAQNDSRGSAPAQHSRGCEAVAETQVYPCVLSYSTSPFCCLKRRMWRCHLCSKVISKHRHSQHQTPSQTSLEQHPGSNKLSGFQWWIHIKENETSFLISLQYCFPIWFL